MMMHSFLIVNNSDKKCFDAVEVIIKSNAINGDKFSGDFETSHIWTDLFGKTEKYSVLENYGTKFNTLQKNNFTFINRYMTNYAMLTYFGNSGDPK